MLFFTAFPITYMRAKGEKFFQKRVWDDPQFRLPRSGRVSRQKPRMGTHPLCLLARSSLKISFYNPKRFITGTAIPSLIFWNAKNIWVTW